MKILSLIIALIAITTLELQATNPCLCEFFLERFKNQSVVDSLMNNGYISNPDSVKIDTCSSSPFFSKLYVQTGSIVFENFNPFTSSTFSTGQNITVANVDTVNYSYIRTALNRFSSFLGTSTFTPNPRYLDVSNGTFLNNVINLKVIFTDYFRKDALDSLGGLIDTFKIKRAYFQSKGPIGITSVQNDLVANSGNNIYYELKYKIVKNEEIINLAETFDEVIIIDILGKSFSYKLTDKINLQEMDEKIYILIARKGDKYYKTKFILE